MNDIKEHIKLKNFYSAGIYIISAILLFSGFSKIVDPEPLTSTLKSLNILPETLIILAAIFVPVCEILLGIFLLVKLNTKLTLLISGILFMCFLIFSIYGTLTELDQDCGCFGNVIKSDIGWPMVIRNSLLFIVVLLLYLYSAYRNVQTK